MRSAIVVACLAFPVVAAADTVVATATEPPPTTVVAPAAEPPPTTVVATAAEPPPPPVLGTHLRNGFSASLGEELGSGPSSGLSGQLYGVDWRIGAKLAGPWSVYADTHLSLGTAKIGGTSGYTGNFAVAAMGERELPSRTFVAAGGGYGVLNNPSGLLAQVRGGINLGGDDLAVSRRWNVALDARFYFAGDQIGTVSQLSLTLGYDRF